MPQIPRQFLERPGMPSAGRRQHDVARTKPGVGLEVEAIVNATKVGDYTPIGNALVRAGIDLEEVERHRSKAEGHLRRMKQEGAARSLMVNAIQRTSDLYENLKRSNISDPEEARTAFEDGVNEIMGADNEVLQGLGEYAVEAYGETMAKTLVQLGPQLTAHSIDLSRDMLEEQTFNDIRSAVHGAATIGDDSVAEQQVELVINDVLNNSGAYWSKSDSLAIAKKATSEFVGARFRHKFAQAPAAAMKYLDAQTGIDPEVKHKLRTEVVSEASQFNNYLEAQQNAQDKEAAKQKDDHFVGFWADYTKMIAQGDHGGMASMLDTITKNPKMFNEDDYQTLTIGLAKALEPGPGGPSIGLRGFHTLNENPGVPVKDVRAYLNSVAGQLNNTDYEEAVKALGARETRQGTASLATQSAIIDTISTRLKGLSGTPDEKYMTKAEQDQAAMGNMNPVLDRQRREQAGVMAKAERQIRVMIDTALHTDSPQGTNYEALERQRPIIEDAIVRQYEGYFKDPSKQPKPFAYTLKNSFDLYKAGKLDDSSMVPILAYHRLSKLDENGNYDPAKDTELQEVAEYRRQQIANRDAARGALSPKNAAGQGDKAPYLSGKSGEQNAVSDVPEFKPLLPGQTLGNWVTDEGLNDLYTRYGFRALSMSEESGGRGHSVGKEEDGTRSYGLHQINETNMPEFINSIAESHPKEAAALRKHKPGSEAFNATWKKLARSGPGLEDAQLKFTDEKFYKPAKARFEEIMGLDVDSMPEPIQMAIYSASIQHGKYWRIFEGAKKKLVNPDLANPTQILEAVYAARNEYVQKLDMKPATKVSLKERYQREAARAIQFLGKA